MLMLQYVLVEHPYFAATGLLYAISMALYVAIWFTPSKLIARLATASMVIAVLVNLGLFVGMWIQADRAPLKSLFETAIFLALNIGILYLVMERLYRTRIFGVVAAAFAMASIAFALGKWDAEIQKLPAALQSAWFVPHVWVYFVGYAAVAIAAGISVVQLLVNNSSLLVAFARKPLTIAVTLGLTVAASAAAVATGRIALLSLAAIFPILWVLFFVSDAMKSLLSLSLGSALTGQELNLERIAYDAIKFGFVLLTLGLLVGSVWAKSAWGDFWVWDPKENWSLVTWLVYGAYLHLRKLKGWRGDAAAWVAIIGFAVVIFTYVGIGMLPTADESAHVYTDN